jgi:hypothetical protein
MIRGIPCFLALGGPLTLEELLAPVEPWKGILLAVVGGEGELVGVDVDGEESAWLRSPWLDL